MKANEVFGNSLILKGSICKSRRKSRDEGCSPSTAQFTNRNLTDIMDLLFFDSPDFHFILANGGILNASGPKDFPSNISASLDAFTKAFYLAIMVDLGSTMTTTIVSNPRLLESRDLYTVRVRTSDGFFRFFFYRNTSYSHINLAPEYY